MKKENKSERVIVHVRMRPFSEEEIKHDNTSPIENFDTINNTISIKKDFDKKVYNYDTVINMNAKQKDVFDKTAKDVVDSVIKGYNGTIFAYGQTGTGKTHTMVGNFEDINNKGIIPRSFDHMFETIKNDKDFHYNISISFIQIYLESIQDLLEPSNENIRIREDPENGVYLEGVEWMTVKSPEDCRQVFLCGEKNRTVAATKMNAHSSRSHAIMIIKIEKGILISPEKIKEIATSSPDALKNERVMTKSLLFLVDLAGSERVKKTGADSIRLNEAKKINFSLLVLGNCIKSLSDGKGGHVSYRDSKLTRLLQESLGGNAKTSLIVTISPSSYNTDESISSLGFGQRAMKVQNKPNVNKTVDYQALSIKLQEDLDKLNDEYSKLKIENDKLMNENNKLKNGETFVEMQRKSISIMDPNALQELIRATSPQTNLKDVPQQGTNMEFSNNTPFNVSLNSQLNNTSPGNIPFKGDYKEELKRLEAFYEQMIQSKDLEQERILYEVDKILLEKECENEDLKSKNIEITNKYNIIVDLLKDYEIEKDDYQKSIIELTNKLEENKKASEKFVSQLKKLQTIKPDEKSILNQLSSNLNNNNSIISQILENENKLKDYNSILENICTNCKNSNSIDVGKSIDFSENSNDKNKIKLGFICLDNFTNKFIETLRGVEKQNELNNKQNESLFKENEIKILELENLIFFILGENKILREKTGENQNTIFSSDNRIKELINREEKSLVLVEDLRKEKLNLQKKINDINEFSLQKDSLSIEKLDKQETYYKMELSIKEEEIKNLKNNLPEKMKKILELEEQLKNLKLELERKNDEIFEFKNKSIDKNQIQIYYSELYKNTENFISEKQKILDKNMSIFKEVDENISFVKSDIKNLKTFFHDAENAKKFNLDNLLNESNNISPNINYLTSIEKILENFEDNINKIDDYFLANFTLKHLANLSRGGNSLMKQNSIFYIKNNSICVNNKKNSIICRVENSTNTSSMSKNNTTMDMSLTEGNLLILNNKEKPSELINENINSSGRSNIDFENFNKNFVQFNESIEKINTDYSDIIGDLMQSVKFLLEISRQFKKIFSEQNFDLNNSKLEIELANKNQNFLKNSIVFLQQYTVESFFNVIPKGEFDEIISDLNNLSSSIVEMDAPEIVKISTNILNEINQKINNFINEKDLIVQNLNEKLNYLNKEAELLKKVETSKNDKDKKDKATNTQLFKLQAQLKLKEEEITRLNERIEEHIITINRLSKEQTSMAINITSENLTPEKKETIGSFDKLGYRDNQAEPLSISPSTSILRKKHTLNIGTINIANLQLPQNSNNGNNIPIPAFSSPYSRRESSILEFKNNFSTFEDEIKELRNQINEQKQTFEKQIKTKEEIYKEEIERIHDIELLKKTQKDANTGRYLIKDYLLRTHNFVDELWRFLNPE